MFPSAVNWGALTAGFLTEESAETPVVKEAACFPSFVLPADRTAPGKDEVPPLARLIKRI